MRSKERSWRRPGLAYREIAGLNRLHNGGRRITNDGLGVLDHARRHANSLSGLTDRLLVTISPHFCGLI